MSILKHFNWEHQIIFNDGSITNLFIENPITFREYAGELLSQINGEEGNFILSLNNEEISIPKNIAIIPDPLNLQFDEKKINAKINKDLLFLIAKNAEIQKNSFPLLSMLEQYANTLKDSYGYNINYEIPDDSTLIKLLSFHIDVEFEEQTDKILEWMNITHDILKIENFIILNMQTYFSTSEIETICAEASSSKHNLLLINQFNTYNKSNSILIDNDNCELFKSPIS